MKNPVAKIFLVSSEDIIDSRLKGYNPKPFLPS